MKRKAVALIILLALIAAACSTSPDEVEENGVTVSTEGFCPQVERDEVDFAVLNDVRYVLENHSVFQDTATNPAHLLNSALETTFQWLGVSRTQIPEWAREITDAEVQRAQAENRPPDFSVLNQVYNELIEDERYRDLRDPSRLEDFLETLIRGTVDALGDPFTSYMEANHFLAGAHQSMGRYQGVGITLNRNSRGDLAVGSVQEGTPAERAGLEIGDAILKVNGLSTEECTTQQFILRTRTLQNPVLHLTIEREERGTLEREVFEKQVEMEEIQQIDLATYPAVNLPAGRGTTLEDVPYRCGEGRRAVGEPCPFDDEDGNPEVLYIKINRFTDQMRHDLEHALRELDQEYGLDSFSGIVVDVRDNPGGLVSATVDTIDFFLASRDVILKRQTAEGVTSIYRAREDAYVHTDTPVTVLMNEDSASGAEVFAAALRDNDRAVVVNDHYRSRGKGTVNTWFPLRSGTYGALHVSIEKWLTPNDEFIETQDTTGDGYDDVGGLEPDLHVPWSNEDHRSHNRDINYDPTLSSALEWLKEQLE